MTHDFNDTHQLKISKLQERLNNISTGLRKNLATEIQKEKQRDIGNLYSSIAPSLTQRQQKQSYAETEKKLFEKEIFQQIKHEKEHKPVETTNIEETQQKSNDDFSSENLKKQELDEINTKQNVMQYSKSWQPWTFIPREKLQDLEKKTLSRFLKKH
ncbi:MAG: hypothetical protein ACREA1_03735 [Nitrosotalea sp.]